MNAKILFVILALLSSASSSISPSVSSASVILGSGFNSATGGRLVPSLNLGIGGDSFEVLASSTGVSTKAYYHSAYTLGAYRVWSVGDLGWGRVTAGFGGGVLYAKRGFKEVGANEETKSDYVVGPAFFGRWNFLGPVFLSVEAIYGLVGPSSRNHDLLGLNARDHVNFILGISL